MIKAGLTSDNAGSHLSIPRDPTFNFVSRQKLWRKRRIHVDNTICHLASSAVWRQVNIHARWFRYEKRRENPGHALRAQPDSLPRRHRPRLAGFPRNTLIAPRRNHMLFGSPKKARSILGQVNLTAHRGQNVGPTPSEVYTAITQKKI